MHSLSPAILVFLVLLGVGTQPGPGERPATTTLFDFEGEAEPWQVVNDGVMGGRSKGRVTVEAGVLRFSGTLVTRGGGFTSVRIDRRVDLGGYAGLELRVRGGGRTFEVEVDDGTRRWRRSVSRRASFETGPDWSLVRVPFEALEASIFGEPVAADPLDSSAIASFGFYILDGIDGPFELEVDEISAYRAGDD